MEKYKWIIEILFGGLGTALIGWLLFNNINKKHSQKQKSGKGSINVQVGKDFTIKNDSKRE
ncbi:hypothetical protein OQJ13_07985 [Legionella sp. PATHC035]|uniref:hypothetical protein n=1 Tax=Legionella sp. PATHC035 TaxID=2992040 RepID=UPI002242CF4E|nr:hypothetical protein [Legionella sp. PATHC035]MCW8408909.1 hypothetical protein [Legionella sp. PATHC035]